VSITALWQLDLVGPLAAGLVVLAIFVARVVALRFRLHAPGPWRGRG
jgi:hypothetical protein